MSARWLLALTVVTAMAPYRAGNSQELQGCENVASAYFSKAPRETIEAFTRSDLETKYRIYLFGKALRLARSMPIRSYIVSQIAVMNTLGIQDAESADLFWRFDHGQQPQDDKACAIGTA